MAVKKNSLHAPAYSALPALTGVFTAGTISFSSSCSDELDSLVFGSLSELW